MSGPRLRHGLATGNASKARAEAALKQQKFGLVAREGLQHLFGQACLRREAALPENEPCPKPATAAADGEAWPDDEEAADAANEEDWPCDEEAEDIGANVLLDGEPCEPWEEQGSLVACAHMACINV